MKFSKKDTCAARSGRVSHIHFQNLDTFVPEELGKISELMFFTHVT